MLSSGILTALDSQAASFLMEATSGRYHPEADSDNQVKQQRVALIRLFIYSRNEFRRGVVVDTEIDAIKDPQKRRIHEGVPVLIGPIGQLDEVRVKARSRDLQQHYPNNVNDCRIVAEAECGQIEQLVSFDRDLKRRLSPHTSVRIMTPVECWNVANISKGSKPVWRPAPGNPLASQSWWCW
jgi:predicted nucleic acid-binding protein